MPISMVTAIAQIRDLLDEVADFERIYAPSETDANAIPAALKEFPAIVVVPGPTLGYILSGGQHRHTYEVKILVFVAGGQLATRASKAAPLPDQIIEKFTGNVTLGNRVNSCVYERSSGFVTLEYGGSDYLGWEITLKVSEQAAATPATGS